MLDCFDGLVWNKAACSPVEGAASLQSIGIDETLIGKLTGPEDTVESMLSDCEEHARAIMHNDVVGRFADRILPRTFLDRKHVGEACSTRSLTSGATGLHGLVIEVNQKASNALVRISSLGVYSDIGGVVPVKVYDLEDGREVASVDVTTVANELSEASVEIVLKASRRRKEYFIAAELASFYCTGMSNCGSCGDSYTHGGATIYGARVPNGSQPIKSNASRTSFTGGVSATVSVECDHGQILCELKGALALPYLYKVGQAIMIRGVHQMGRLNDQTLDREQLRERADDYGRQYVDAMANSLGRAILPDDPMCFSCAAKTRSTISIP